MQLSLRWAKRSKEAHQGNSNALFGIIQGGMYEEYERSAKAKYIAYLVSDFIKSSGN
jgi:tRNA-guanine family transglycosylase